MSWASPPVAAPGPPFAGATLYPTVENTWFMPAQLSWNLGNGWFASGAFAFYAPDGSRYNGSPNPDYWTYELRGAVSYLSDGWNLTANLIYDFNTPSAGHTGVGGLFAGTAAAVFFDGYRSGDQHFLISPRQENSTSGNLVLSHFSNGKLPPTLQAAGSPALQWRRRRA